jgi:hypothetical protein
MTSPFGLSSIQHMLLPRFRVTVDRVLDIGFVDHLQVVTTNNCNTIADIHALPVTATYAKSFQSAVSSSVIFWQRILTQ